MTEQDVSSSTPLPSLANLQRLAISESGFVFDPVTGHNFTVNETGLDILRLTQKTNDIQALLDQLAAAYDVSSQQLERDVFEFAAILRDYFSD